MHNTNHPTLLLLASLGVACAACGTSDQDSTLPAPDAGLPAPDAGDPADSGDASNENVLPVPEAGTDSDQEGGICQAVGYDAEPSPLAILFLLDRSGSMAGPRWEQASVAVGSFLQLQQGEDLDIGLQYFPKPWTTDPPETCEAGPDACGDYGPCTANHLCIGALAEGLSCTASDYAMPVFPIAPIDVNHAPMMTDIGAQQPYQGTPTRFALEGALAYTRSWNEANPSHVAAVIMATDGSPEGCLRNSIPEAADVARAQAEADPPVRTFVIAIQNQAQGVLDVLDDVAAAGGTDQAFLIDGSSAFAPALAEALDAARSRIACAFDIPEPNDETVDSELLNVAVQHPNGDEAMLGMVDDASSCSLTEGGWYYDDPVAPSRVVLCPDACEQVNESEGASVAILLGCKTVVQEVY